MDKKDTCHFCKKPFSEHGHKENECPELENVLWEEQQHDYVEMLRKIKSILDSADRTGATEDVPEGTRYIQLSDTLARQLSLEINAKIST